MALTDIDGSTTCILSEGNFAPRDTDSMGALLKNTFYYSNAFNKGKEGCSLYKKNVSPSYLPNLIARFFSWSQHFLLWSMKNRCKNSITRNCFSLDFLQSSAYQRRFWQTIYRVQKNSFKVTIRFWNQIFML